MAVLGRVAGAHGPTRSTAAMASAAARLLRTYAIQVEALRRLRNGGSQFVRVEHVHVNDGGQAVIGAVAVDRTTATTSMAATPPKQSRPSMAEGDD
jgi:hypothetical protein